MSSSVCLCRGEKTIDFFLFFCKNIFKKKLTHEIQTLVRVISEILGGKTVKRILYRSSMMTKRLELVLMAPRDEEK